MERLLANWDTKLQLKVLLSFQKLNSIQFYELSVQKFLRFIALSMESTKKQRGY